MTATIGEQLKETRTRRGLTLDQVSQTTHIRRNFLEALENDQRDVLPSKVQGRGFLRLYAGYLGMPEGPLLDAWDGKLTVEEQKAEDKKSSDSTKEVEKPSKPGRRSLFSKPVRNVETPSRTEPDAPPTLQGPEENTATTIVPALLVPEETKETTETLPAEPAIRAEPLPPVPVQFQNVSPSSPHENGSYSIFTEIGQKLRQQREALGLSLVEVERYTRLRTHYLQALEEGRMDLLPSPVQGRGMLSNYASFLNLNEDALLLRFAEGLQQRRIERLPPPDPQPAFNKKKPARPASALRRFLTPDLIFGTVVVVAILFFAIRTAMNISTIRPDNVQPTTRAIADILLTPKADETPGSPGTPNTPAAVQPAVNPGGSTGNNSLPTATSGGNQSAGVGTETLRPGQPTVNSVTLDPNATIGPINNDPLQVYIIAHQRAFLRIVVDNQEKFNGRVVPGNAYAYSGLKSITLLTGNAAALQIYFNQNDLGTLGVAGQVVDLVFSQDGMLTATPLPTPTHSATPLVTPTQTGTILTTPYAGTTTPTPATPTPTP